MASIVNTFAHTAQYTTGMGNVHSDNVNIDFCEGR